MPRKTAIVRLLGFLLATNIGSACFGGDQPPFFKMTETFNAKWNERIWDVKNLQDAQRGQRLNALSKSHVYSWSCDHNYWYLSPPFHLSVRKVDLQKPPRSKFRLPDDPIGVLTITFQGCTRLRILTVDTSGAVAAHLAGILKDDLYDCNLVLKQTETSDVFASRLVYQLLVSTIQPTEYFDWYSEGISADEEANAYKPFGFAPNIVFEFEGKDSLRIELDTQKLCAMLRTKDKWGSYTYDQLSATAIEARVKDLHALYTNTTAPQSETP